MFQALSEIGQKHGLVGLWRGALGSLPRVIVGSSTQLCTFSSTKDFITQWEVLPRETGGATLGMRAGGGQAEGGPRGQCSRSRTEQQEASGVSDSLSLPYAPLVTSSQTVHLSPRASCPSSFTVLSHGVLTGGMEAG